MGFKNRISENIELKKALLANETIEKNILIVVEKCIFSLKNGGKIFFCGNGGSAADSMHLAAELSGKYYHNRAALNAESLSADTVLLTAISNDYGFEFCFSKQLDGKAKRGDVLISLTTSGQSKNIINAVSKGNELGLVTFSFTGIKTSDLDSISNLIIKIPSSDTPRIQECHMLLGHIVCEMIETYFVQNSL